MSDTTHRFQLGEYWLKQIPGRPGWYAFHYDKSARTTKRERLQTPLGASEEEARVAFAQFVTLKGKIVDARPENFKVIQLLLRYRARHTDDTTGHAIAKLEWFGEDTVSDLTMARQRAFVEAMGAQGLSPGTIRRYLTVLSAAHGEAVYLGEMASAPKIILAESEIAQIINAPGKIKERRLSVEELATFADAIKSPHIWRYFILALTTVARPDALTDLTVFQTSQSLIDLNPQGRRQNKKFRPIVPTCPTLAGWLPIWREQDRLTAERRKWKVVPSTIIHYKGQPISNPKIAIKKTALECGLVAAADFDENGEVLPYRAVTPYTFRRTMGRLLRAEGVPLADVGGYMGHAIPGVSTTEIYADADPNYMRVVVDGIERILEKIEAHCRAPLRVSRMIRDHSATTNDKKPRIYLG